MRLAIQRAALVCLSLVAAAATAELAARTFMPQDIGCLAPWYQSHPVYRFRHYPGMDEMRSFIKPYRLRTNSHGVGSDHEEPYESPGETRIVVHGDSLAFGIGVENEETFVHKAQSRLRRTRRGVDVLNLAVSAHGPDQEYLLFLEEGRKYLPRIVVIAVYLGNDLDDLARPDVAFRLEDERLAYVPYEPPIWKTLAETAVYRWLGARSHLLILARHTFADRPIRARHL